MRGSEGRPALGSRRDLTGGLPGRRDYDLGVSEADYSASLAVANILRSIDDLAEPLERSAILEKVGKVAAESIDASLGFIGLINGPDQLRLTAIHGGTTGVLETLEVERGRGLGGKVLALGDPASVEDYCVADTITHEYDVEIAAEGLRGVMGVPLVVEDSLLGVVYVSERVPTAYSDAMVERVITAVEGAKIALSMAGRSRELTEAALALERERTVSVLDASVNDHLAAILESARSIACDPTSSKSLIDLAGSIIETAGRASALFDHSATQLLSGPSAPTRRSAADFDLTARELQVVRLAARGLSNPEIATELFLARGTVKAYMASALGKLDARNRVEAVMIAARSGLLDEL